MSHPARELSNSPELLAIRYSCCSKYSKVFSGAYASYQYWDSVTMINLREIRTEPADSWNITVFILFVALGDPCLDTTDCSSVIPYSYCISSRCQCSSGYFEDPVASNVCVAGKCSYTRAPFSLQFNITIWYKLIYLPLLIPFRICVTFCFFFHLIFKDYCLLVCDAVQSDRRLLKLRQYRPPPFLSTKEVVVITAV
jgi:hypothetical protein